MIGEPDDATTTRIVGDGPNDDVVDGPGDDGQALGVLDASSSDLVAPPPPETTPTLAVAPLRASGRRATELQLIGLVALAWGVVFTSAWAWAQTCEVLEAQASAQAVRLALPHLLALGVVSLQTLLALPSPRWDRRGNFRRRLPWAFLAAGWPLIPIAAVVVLRDRWATRQIWSPEAVQSAFVQLLRLPGQTAVRFAVWATLAFSVDALLMADDHDASRSVLIALALASIGTTAATATILYGAARGALRAEVLAARPATHPGRASDLSARLHAQLLPAVFGAIVTLVAGGYAWSTVTLERAARSEAARLSNELLELAAAAHEDALGRMLALHPDATVDDGTRRLGHPRPVAFDRDGPIDADGDGVPELYAARRTSVAVVVPLRPVAPPSLAPGILVGLFASIVLVASSAALARDTTRDVVRTTAHLSTVAGGRAPAPLGPHSFATAELRRLVAAIDQLVGRITEENVEKYVAIEKAKEADRLKSQFLANMSHDLRSPLNSILGFSELLLSGIDGPLSAEQRELVATIHSTGRELLQQIDDILDTAKIDAGRLEIHPEPTPPATFVARAAQNAHARRPDIEFAVDTSAGLPPAFVDPYRTVQALENMMTFAATGMADGVVNVNVRMSTSGKRRMIAVEVVTPVRPPSAEHMSQLRRGFRRLPGHRGLGLSLPIAGAILELQGGGLTLRARGDGLLLRADLRGLELRRPPVARNRSDGA